MVLFSQKCVRCNKINCKKFFSCVQCNILQCEECLDITNINRLKFRILKNDKIGNEKTIYCVNHCIKTKKYCRDCGKSFSNLISCKQCKSFFCLDCNDRNIINIEKYFLENDNNYNKDIINLCKNYCCNECFELDFFYYSPINNICINCGNIFEDSYSEGICSMCLHKKTIDLDLFYNKNRCQLQKKVLNLIKNNIINKLEFIEKIGKEMIEQIKNNKTMIENNLCYNDWIFDIDEGANRCFLLYDECVLNILNVS